MRTVSDILEGVEQDDGHRLLVRGQLGELPGQEVRVERQRVQVRLSLQQVLQPGAAGQCPDRLTAFAQRLDQGTGEGSDGGADGAGQKQCLGDIGERGLHLLRHRLAEPRGQTTAVQVLLQALAGMLLFPIAAQRDVEGRQRMAYFGERGADGEHQVLKRGAGRAGQVDAYGKDALPGPGGLTPLRRPLVGARERGLQLPRQARLADSADTVEHDDVVPWPLQVLDVESGIRDMPQVLTQRGRDQLPLRLTVRERLRRRHRAVVRAEQRPEIPACHNAPDIVDQLCSTYVHCHAFEGSISRIDRFSCEAGKDGWNLCAPRLP
ncbi:hypothetical protein [Streptomyces subrutilus]|uniref:hypothetical protein n=1 Tax=Streptomyces subrutilus TaxID=36818 RepID=UPI0026C4FB39